MHVYTSMIQFKPGQDIASPNVLLKLDANAFDVQSEMILMEPNNMLGSRGFLLETLRRQYRYHVEFRIIINPAKGVPKCCSSVEITLNDHSILFAQL